MKLNPQVSTLSQAIPGGRFGYATIDTRYWLAIPDYVVPDMVSVSRLTV